MKVKIKKLDEKAILPIYAKEGDAGMDLVGITKTFSDDHLYVEFGTGLAVEIPKGYVGLVFPRSSISEKSQTFANAVGVIDSGYRGELRIRLKMDANAAVYVSSQDSDYQFEGWSPSAYKVGDKIAQLVILPYPHIEFDVVDELSTSQRGEGGFGHTDIQGTLDFEV